MWSMWLSSDLGCVSVISVTALSHQLRPSSQGCNMALMVLLLLLLHQPHSSYQQTPFAPLDSSMRSLTMLARDFPSIEAVPDATFGEFQEVRLPEPRTPPPPPPRGPPPTSPSPAPAPPRNNRPFTNFGQTPTRLPPRVGAPGSDRFPSRVAAPEPDRFPSRGAAPEPDRFPSRGAAPEPDRFPSRGAAPRPTRPPSQGGQGLNIILTADERREILDKLLGRDINSIVLTPLQRLAILQEKEARQSRGRPDTFQTTSRPALPLVTTARPETPRRPPQAIRQENFQTTFRPETSPEIPRRQQTTIKPGVAFQTNFVRQQVNELSDNDENFDYIEDNEVSSKSMVEQTFSLFENFSNRINGGKPRAKPVSPFKRPSLRFLPDPTTKPPATIRPPPTQPSTAAPQRQVAKIRIKLPSNSPRQEGERERPRNFSNFPPRQEIKDRSVIRGNNKISPASSFLPQQNTGQKQTLRTTARPQSFPAVPQQTPAVPTQLPPSLPRASRPPPSNSLASRPPPSNSLSARPPPSNSLAGRPPPSNSIASRPPPSNSLAARPPPSLSRTQVPAGLRAGEIPSVAHPEVLLNMLSASDQDRFLQQFSLLNTQQQNYAFKQFLSSRREIQQFAISQFLKLDPETLIVSIQAEIERDRIRNKSSRRSSSRPRPVPAASTTALNPPQLNSIQGSFGGDTLSQGLSSTLLSQNKPRRAEAQAFKLFKEQQRQQQEQLEEIIKAQNRINLQLQGQNVFL